MKPYLALLSLLGTTLVAAPAFATPPCNETYPQPSYDETYAKSNTWGSSTLGASYTASAHFSAKPDPNSAEVDGGLYVNGYLLGGTISLARLTGKIVTTEGTPGSFNFTANILGNDVFTNNGPGPISVSQSPGASGNFIPANWEWGNSLVDVKATFALSGSLTMPTYASVQGLSAWMVIEPTASLDAAASVTVGALCAPLIPCLLSGTIGVLANLIQAQMVVSGSLGFSGATPTWSLDASATLGSNGGNVYFYGSALGFSSPHVNLATWAPIPIVNVQLVQMDSCTAPLTLMNGCPSGYRSCGAGSCVKPPALCP